MNILVLPKEVYPFKRIRLNQLFMTYFATGKDNVHWISFGDKTNKSISDNNHMNIMTIPLLNSSIGYLIARCFAFKKFFIASKIIKNNNIEIIIANDGIIEGFIAYLLAKRYDIFFAYYLSSLFFNMELNEFLSMPSIYSSIMTIKGYMKKPLYKFLINQATIFHPISESMGSYYIKRGIRKNKVHPLPLCPAKSMFDMKVKDNKDNDNIYKIICIGQITPVRRIEFILKVAHELKKENMRHFKILIIGKIFRKKYKTKLLKMVQQLGIEKEIEIHDEVPFNEIIKFIDESDLGISLLPPILAYRVSSPTKVVEYMARGIPVLVNDEIEDQRKIVTISGAGVAVKYDIYETCTAIEKFMNNVEYGEISGMKGRTWINENRNYQIMVKELKILYYDILKKGGSI